MRLSVKGMRRLCFVRDWAFHYLQLAGALIWGFYDIPIEDLCSYWGQ